MDHVGPKSRLQLQEIADHAGVSVSTVSRVINEIPGISEATIESVQRSIQTLTRRRVEKGVPTRAVASVAGASVAFVVLRRGVGAITPAYERLLRGVTSKAFDCGLDLHVSFVHDAASAIEQVETASYDGVILHGTLEAGEQTLPLHKTPTVWLMGNSVRPDWGDQVMPNNAAIGHLAADYLLKRKHKRVMSWGFRSGWSLGIRMAAFVHAVETAGGSVTTRSLSEMPVDVDKSLDLLFANLVRDYLAEKQRPTGLFIAEDWLVRRAYIAMRAAGMRPGEDLDIISCNNDRPYLVGVSPTPATIDIGYERIAERAVTQLCARMSGNGPPNRLRIVVEPKLVPSPPSPSAPAGAAGNPLLVAN